MTCKGLWKGFGKVWMWHPTVYDPHKACGAVTTSGVTCKWLLSRFGKLWRWYPVTPEGIRCPQSLWSSNNLGCHRVSPVNGSRKVLGRFAETLKHLPTEKCSQIICNQCDQSMMIIQSSWRSQERCWNNYITKNILSEIWSDSRWHPM